MSDKYILDGKTPVPADLMTWARWYETADRSVAKSEAGPYRISTVFLGLNHQFGDGPPLIFETMVFGPPDDDDVWCERCSTWEQAEVQHAQGVAWAESQPVASLEETNALLSRAIKKGRGMVDDRWEIWLHPLTPPVIEALKALDEAETQWRTVRPPVITAARAHVKLMAWSSGATVSPDPPDTPEQKAASAAVSRARFNLDRETANAIGPWCPASHFRRRSA